MASWDLVATIKAPEQQVMAFAAHHLALGAGHLWLYFDDPAAPVPQVLRAHPRVTVTLCDAAYWQARGKRHERHQNRQARNARDAYARTGADWLTHIDVDEFLDTDRDIPAILDGMDPTVRILRLEPFEAMHDPSLPDDIFTARVFRGPLRAPHAEQRPEVLGDYAEIIPEGHLSHTAGKCFFRTGIKGLAPRLHGAFLNGERLPSDSRSEEMRVLHFHAQDRTVWESALPFRLTRGAYQYRPALQDYLQSASPDEIARFYQGTQTLSPALGDRLSALGRVRTVDLHLRDKVSRLQAGLI